MHIRRGRVHKETKFVAATLTAGSAYATVTRYDYDSKGHEASIASWALNYQNSLPLLNMDLLVTFQEVP